MTIEKAILILKQQRAYWSFDISDERKSPLPVLRKDLVEAIDTVLQYIPKEE